MTNVRVNDVYLRVYLLYMYPFSCRNMTFPHRCIPMSHILPVLFVVAHLYLSRTDAEILLLNLIFTSKKESSTFRPQVEWCIRFIPHNKHKKTGCIYKPHGLVWWDKVRQCGLVHYKSSNNDVQMIVDSILCRVN